MANYFNAGISEVSFLADEDLTAQQWNLVMAASTNGYVQLFDILPTAASPRFPIGVLVNSPSLGQEASVKALGFAKARAAVVGGSGLQFGSILSVSNAGHFVSASDDADDPVYGVWFGPDIASGSGYGNVLLHLQPASGLQALNSTN
ncbi:MAG: hypothetical protein ACXABY_02375 [Candidatus Thorarchaeota archaeon]|jgi:hypothetical protein